jgi:hypothetical protein
MIDVAEALAFFESGGHIAEWKPEYRRFESEPTLAYSYERRAWTIVTSSGDVVTLESILERGYLQ